MGVYEDQGKSMDDSRYTIDLGSCEVPLLAEPELQVVVATKDQDYDLRFLELT